MAQDKKKKRAGSAKSLFRIVRYMGHNYPFSLAVTVVCIVLAAVASMFSILFIQRLVDDYITPMMSLSNPDFSNLATAILQLSGVLVVGVAATYGYTRIMVNVSQGTMLKLRESIFEKMEALPIKFFDTTAHGDIMSVYTNDIDTLRQFMGQSAPQMVSAVVTAIATLTSMLILNVPLTFVALSAAVVMVIVTVQLSKNAGKYFNRQQYDIGELDGHIEEMMEGQRVVKVFNHEEKAKKDFSVFNDQLEESADRANRYANMMMPANANIGNLSYVLCATVGALLAIHGWAGITVGIVIAFVALNRSFTQPFMQVGQQMNAIIMAAAGSARVFALMDQNVEKDDGYVDLVWATEDEKGGLKESEEKTGLYAWKHPHKADGSVTYEKLRGEVVFEDVNFEYEPNKTILHDISMYAKPGQKLAFVGATGAGKTTITNLINRFYDIDEGKIRYDGINIEKIKKPALRRTLGMVLQDTNLFTGTIIDNIRYGRLDATDDACISAAKLANADSFITRLPDGYNTVISGNGDKLSQGQRQLLSIARAAVADPPVLILDEATSSIDTRTEELVQNGMDALMDGRTTFAIAHRLSTIQNADVIMVMDHGRIIERGNHEELIAQKGRYYELYTGNFAD